MLTQPLSDFHCLTLLLHVVLERMVTAEAIELAGRFESTNAYAASVRSKPQLDDMPGVLPGSPRLGCVPAQRIRWNADDPCCFERTADYLTVAEIIDPNTPRTAATLRIGGQLHTFPVEHTPEGPRPVILDPQETNDDEQTSARQIPPNLTFATVAHLAGYGAGPSPMSTPVLWAEQVAARDGLQPRNSRDLLAVAERYADLYPGGRQGLAQLDEQVGRAVFKGGKAAVKETGAVLKAGTESVVKRPSVGQALRAALVGYGGPLAVVALDVVENRLNKRGYTLGSVAESRDADVFAIR